MTERITTLHPAGKRGVSIDAAKYTLVKDAILKMLRRYGKVTHGELLDLVREELATGFEGGIVWYFSVVALDLEARRIIAYDRRGKIGTITLAA